MDHDRAQKLIDKLWFILYLEYWETSLSVLYSVIDEMQELSDLIDDLKFHENEIRSLEYKLDSEKGKWFPSKSKVADLTSTISGIKEYCSIQSGKIRILSSEICRLDS